MLEFRIKNYKSFKDEVTFSTISSCKEKNFDYSIFKKKIGKKEIKCLPTSVVYGANASGKTNLISAMETFKRIIEDRKITNKTDYYSPNIAAYNLELIPNCKLDKPAPVDFYIDFIENDYRIKYSISLDLGMFSQVDYNRKILKEKLEINDTNIFERHENEVTMGNLKKIYKFDNDIKKYGILSDSEANDEKKILNSAIENETLLNYITNVDNLDLFLCNSFRINFCAHIHALIEKWMEHKFIVVFRADTLTITPPNDIDEVEPYIYKAAKIFGATSDEFVYIRDPENNKKLYSVINLSAKKIALSSEIFESYGTNRFINLIQKISLAIKNGGTLVFDEFDASLHPMAIINIVNIFHNDEINVKKAQLIFNTHNPVFLRDTVFRRDEIKFTECNEEGYSSLYSLSDFKGVGKSSRKAKDYSENYFVGRYGAVRDIDFSSIFVSEDDLSE